VFSMMNDLLHCRPNCTVISSAFLSSFGTRKGYTAIHTHTHVVCVGGWD